MLTTLLEKLMFLGISCSDPMVDNSCAFTPHYPALCQKDVILPWSICNYKYPMQMQMPHYHDIMAPCQNASTLFVGMGPGEYIHSHTLVAVSFTDLYFVLVTSSCVLY